MSRKGAVFISLVLFITSTLFGVFLDEWLQFILTPLFATEAKAILTGVVIVGFITTLGIIITGFFAQRTEQREQEWLEVIEKRLGTPAEIEFELVGGSGRFNRKLAEYIRKNVQAGDEVLVLATYTPTSPGREKEAVEYHQALEEYSRTLLEKVRNTDVTYRRIVCFREGLGQKIKPGQVPEWLIVHAKEMLEIKRQKPNRVILKKSRVVFGNDLLLVKDKIAAISLDVFNPTSGRFRTYGMIVFYHPPNGNIIQQLYELFMVADSQSVPVEKVPEE